MIVRTIDRLSGLIGAVAGWLVVPLIFAMVYEVVSRYAFNAPTIWAYEVAYLATGASFLLGMAYTLSQGAHIRIDVLSGVLSGRARAVIDIVLYVGLLIPFLAWVSHMLYGRAVAAVISGEHTGASAWNPPLWPLRTVFFIAFVLLLLQVIAEVIKNVRVLLGRDKAAGAR